MTTQLKSFIKEEFQPLGIFLLGIMLVMILLFIITGAKNSFADLLVLGIAVFLFFEFPGYFFLHPLKLNVLERTVLAAPVSVAFNTILFYFISSAFLVRISASFILIFIVIVSLAALILMYKYYYKKRITQ
ncbi:MAG: hypothetical protein KAT43_02985 [Nanoarchaeota archaeon]|nr:hypothetical protein [Nanoarchaeota archaeon]